MAIICPTVTAKDKDSYKQQLDRILPFAQRIHLDFADSAFTDVDLMYIKEAWSPKGTTTDVHLMYKNPLSAIDTVVELNPHLVVVQAESEGDFNKIALKLKDRGILVGISLLPKTKVSIIASVLNMVDHVLVFSGHLGHFGGHADLSLLGKVGEIKEVNPTIEIGWDGGINEHNARTLVVNGVDVLNVGGFIQKSQDPEDAYEKIQRIAT